MKEEENEGVVVKQRMEDIDASSMQDERKKGRKEGRMQSDFPFFEY